MIDPILSLSFAIHSNKGVYALMLGSGISRSAGIPTGWEIVLEIIRKIAKLSGEECEPAPEIWYKNKFGNEPDYSELLNMIAKSPSERCQLLKGYFEPTEEEKEHDLKVPTVAHRAIANLIKDGYIRVVITTNFDRLLERALEDVGIAPTIISTPDAVNGALPMAHTQCTIIKLHGDYVDTRIKNTVNELESYDGSVNIILDRILDEYGLIVCGWSAEWDVALRTAFERCSNHRFTTYWTGITVPYEMAKQIIKIRKAVSIRIKNADDFFYDLSEKVYALQEIDRTHPLSAKLAVARLKKYIPDDRYRIQLHDFVMQESTNLCTNISDEYFSMQTPFSVDMLAKRIKDYESRLEIMISLVINGCYWDKNQNIQLWIKSLEQIANRPGVRSGPTAWVKLREYPSLLLLYAGGIASIANKNFENYAAITTKTCFNNEYERAPFVVKLYPLAVIENQLAKEVFDDNRSYTPVNNHIYEVIREPFKQLIPLDSDYKKYFDYFEYLSGLVFVDTRNDNEVTNEWGPVGCYKWRYTDNPQDSARTLIEKEITNENDNWMPLKANLFNGSIARAREVKSVFEKFLNTIHWY